LGRHPSQLYEAFLEGIVLFTVLLLVSPQGVRGQVSGLLLLLYGVFRFSVEFFRQPDPHWDSSPAWLTMARYSASRSSWWAAGS